MYQDSRCVSHQTYPACFCSKIKVQSRFRAVWLPSIRAQGGMLKGQRIFKPCMTGLAWLACKKKKAAVIFCAPFCLLSEWRERYGVQAVGSGWLSAYGQTANYLPAIPHLTAHRCHFPCCHVNSLKFGFISYLHFAAQNFYCVNTVSLWEKHWRQSSMLWSNCYVTGEYLFILPSLIILSNCMSLLRSRKSSNLFMHHRLCVTLQNFWFACFFLNKTHI